MKNTFSLLICLCTFIFVHPAYAAPFPSLTGSVTDTTGLLTGKKDIIDRAERFQQNTGITVYILFTHQENIIPAIILNFRQSLIPSLIWITTVYC